MFSLMILYLYDYPGIQLILNVLLSMMDVIYKLELRPMENLMCLRLDMFNDVMTFLISDLLFTQTYYVTNQSVK